ncbi:MAG TPA: neutral/alkaline non-lysosomal ceramidase N-terminal domain-containing protein, partial [Spirochaetia bacterium]|nr:neutral/alkaline non-lysosomal ceramidase N-terminal domain-containing protein [Spirochaetia bacterium]
MSSSGSLRIGWAEIDVTPESTIDLWGQYYHRKSRGIHSRLSATALAVESEGAAASVLVSVDSAGFQSDFQDEVRRALRSRVSGLDAGKVVLNATHTHNAPGVDLIKGIGWLKELPDVMPIRQYRGFLADRICTAVSEAWAARRPAGVGNALGHARVGHCRRAVYYNRTAEMYGLTDRDDFAGMEGGEDSGVDLLFTFDPAGKPVGVILNLACPSQVMESTYLVSSDFMGETRRRLKERFGADFRVLAQIGAAGCQSPRDLARGYRGAEPDFWHEDGVTEIGRRLLAAVEEALPRAAARIDYSPAVRHTATTVSLPRRRASEQDRAAAQRELAALTA